MLVLTSALLLAAGVAVILRVGRSGEPLELDPRPLEARPSYPGASHYRPYAPLRGSREGAGREIPLRVLSRLEEARDYHGVATAYLLMRRYDDAEVYLDRAGRSLDLDSDRAVVALGRGRMDVALRLVDGVLATHPRHPQALWNRALVLRDLGLPLAAAQAFLRFAELGEPGWSDEASRRARELATGPETPRQLWARLNRAGMELALSDRPLAAEDIRIAPGLARLYLYHGIRAATSREQLMALLPTAEQIDRTQHGSGSVAYLQRVAAADFSRRAPLAATYREVLGGRQLSPAEQEAWLDRLRRSGEQDLLLGALMLLHRTREHLAEYAALAEASGDAWYHGPVQQELARAELDRDAPLAAEQRLVAALADCGREELESRCLALHRELGDLYLSWHRSREAEEHERVALRLARRGSDFSQAFSALNALQQGSRLQGEFALARAYQEELLQIWDDCEARRRAHEERAMMALYSLDVTGAGREMAKAPRCKTPHSLLGTFVLADLSRFGEAQVAEVQAELGALRARGELSAGERLLADHIEGRLLIERDRATGQALLWRTIREAERLQRSDVYARQARAFSYDILIVDAARAGDYAGALSLFGEELERQVPARCVLGVTISDERSVVVARGAGGERVGRFEGHRTSAEVELARFVPEPVKAVLRPCEQVVVLAEPLLHGRPLLLPPEMAWSYQAGPLPQQVDSRRLPPRRVVISDVEPPKDLNLQRLTPWAPPGPDAVPTVHLRQGAATPARVLEEIVDATEIEFHVHGLADPGHSETSILVLSEGGDGRYALTSDEVRHVRLRAAPLVVLAACDAAWAVPTLYVPRSLPMAFIEAGARMVLAPATPIADDGASRFFSSVLERIRQGAPPAVALRDERLRWRGDRNEDWVRQVVLFE